MRREGRVCCTCLQNKKHRKWGQRSHESHQDSKKFQSNLFSIDLIVREVNDKKLIRQVVWIEKSWHWSREQKVVCSHGWGGAMLRAGKNGARMGQRAGRSWACCPAAVRQPAVAEPCLSHCLTGVCPGYLLLLQELLHSIFLLPSSVQLLISFDLPTVVLNEAELWAGWADFEHSVSCNLELSDLIRHSGRRGKRI